MKNPFKKELLTNVILIGVDGSIRYGLNSMPKDPELSEVKAATIKEVQQYLKGGLDVIHNS